MKRAYIFNTGCIRRALDSTRIYNYLTENGWVFTNHVSSADLVIIGTYGAVQKTENLSLVAIRNISRKKSESAKVIITGCLPNINPDRILQFGDYIFVPTRDLDDFDVILDSKIKLRDISDANMVTNKAHIFDYVLAYRLFRNSNSLDLFSKFSTYGFFQHIRVLFKSMQLLV